MAFFRIQRIEHLSTAEDTDTIIATADAIYNTLFHSDFEAIHGDLQKVMAVTPEELIEYRQHRSMSEEQMETVLKEYLSVLKQDMHRLTHMQPNAAGRFTPAIPSEDDEIQEPSPEAAQKSLPIWNETSARVIWLRWNGRG